MSESRGARRLPVSQWFVRAAHAYVAAVTAPGVDGPLYEVDMRLRPSGNKGPVAVSLGSFRRYHAEVGLDVGAHGADPRPRRGRPAGTARAHRGGDRRGAGCTPAMPDASAPMPRRCARACCATCRRTAPWDVKLRAGGQIEVEFIAQVLQLIHAREAPALCSPTTRIALARLAKAGSLPADDAALLIRADHVWRTVQGMLRITVGRGAREELPDASAQRAARASPARRTAVDLDAAARHAG